MGLFTFLAASSYYLYLSNRPDQVMIFECLPAELPFAAKRKNRYALKALGVGGADGLDDMAHFYGEEEAGEKRLDIESQDYNDALNYGAIYANAPELLDELDEPVIDEVFYGGPSADSREECEGEEGEAFAAAGAPAAVKRLRSLSDVARSLSPQKGVRVNRSVSGLRKLGGKRGANGNRDLMAYYMNEPIGTDEEEGSMGDGQELAVGGRAFAALSPELAGTGDEADVDPCTSTDGSPVKRSRSITDIARGLNPLSRQGSRTNRAVHGLKKLGTQTNRAQTNRDLMAYYMSEPLNDDFAAADIDTSVANKESPLQVSNSNNQSLVTSTYATSVKRNRSITDIARGLYPMKSTRSNRTMTGLRQLGANNRPSNRLGLFQVRKEDTTADSAAPEFVDHFYNMDDRVDSRHASVRRSSVPRPNITGVSLAMSHEAAVAQAEAAVAAAAVLNRRRRQLVSVPSEFSVASSTPSARSLASTNMDEDNDSILSDISEALVRMRVLPARASKTNNQSSSFQPRTAALKPFMRQFEDDIESSSCDSMEDD